MSTPLTDRINALTASANATTGASDTTLTDAVGTLIAGFGGGVLWKTHTFESNHESTSRSPSFWMETFEISEQDILDGNIFIMVFSGNTIDTNHSYIIIYYPTSDGVTVGATSIRNGGTNVTYGLTRYAWVVAGAVVNIYKIKGAF